MHISPIELDQASPVVRRIYDSHRSDLFEPAEEALLRYTDLLTTRPENVWDVDLEALSAFFSEEQIIELALIVATANWTTCINEGLQTPLR